MKTLYFDLKNGISGDMAVAALLNLNAMSFKELSDALKSLNLKSEFSLEYKTHNKFEIFGSDFFVNLNSTHEHMNEHNHVTNEHIIKSSDKKNNDYAPQEGSHGHRKLSDIRKIINDSKISDKAKKLSLDIFENLAKAESEVHQKSKDEVAFHEVGAVDSIIDIVAFSVLFCAINPQTVICSDVNLGGGTVECAHGVLNVPAPAVINLTKGMSVFRDEIKFETTTPTGAAIVKTIVSEFADNFNGVFVSCGVGFGKTDFKIRPNALNVYLLEDKCLEDKKTDIINNYETDEVVQIETNIDNTVGEDLGYCAKLLMETGALDVYFTPIFMKKFRPAYKLEVLCKKSDLEKMAEIIFSNTSTIGLRYSIKQRKTLRRENFIKETKYGKVSCKKLTRHGEVSESLEFDDLEKIAHANKISIKEARKI
ncbi:MAG: nickel pincer cofactor biosynthesis protein LarC [Firmicutes bacterium]|nr:nickel pincer cofactor biosynthesis protein LarC [Bacillota bacterium]